jgi:hypothetical protein
MSVDCNVTLTTGTSLAVGVTSGFSPPGPDLAPGSFPLLPGALYIGVTIHGHL